MTWPVETGIHSEAHGKERNASRSRFPGPAVLIPSPELIRDRAPILAPALVAGVLSLATVVATLPLVRLAYAAHPELSVPAGDALWAMGLLSPFATLLKGVLLGGVAWSVLVLSGTQVRYRTLTSAVIYGQIILVLQGAWVTALLWMRGAAALHQPSDLMLPMGLDAFVSNSSSALAVVARSVTPFYCAWFVFLSVVITRAARSSWWRGTLATFTIWILVTGVGVVRALVT